MKTLTTFAALTQISGTGFLNPLQTIVAGAKKADTNNDLTSLVNGADVKVWQYKAGITAGASPVKIDADIDWRDRIVFGLYIEMTASANGLGGASEYQFSSVDPFVFSGYTGTGGLTAGGLSPSAANPPVLASGKYLVQADSANKVLLYAGNADGSLYVYNNTAGTIYPVFIVFALGDAGFH